MLRLGSRGCVMALLGVLSLCVLACNKSDARSGTIGSPNASVAGSEARTPSSSAAGTSAAGNANALARSVVAVATTSPGDAQPCERTCGRVGDCLLETKDVGEFEAGRLELQCLDVCVHSPETDGPRSAFLACEQQSSCEPLLGCARSNWEALVAARSGPSVQGITTGGDSCFDSCQWWLSCAYTGLPPDQASLSADFQESLRSCETQCEVSPADREFYTRLADCMRVNCPHDRQEICYENLH
jgi:hypothetical protein